MKNLVIVESPSKSKTIGKYLGEDYKVVSSKGHVRDLAIKGKDGLGVDIEHDFQPTYEVPKEKAEVVQELRREAKKAEHIILATDPDREGEAISWHLAQELGLADEAADRVTFNEITRDTVLANIEHPRPIDMDLVSAQETRRILDRIIGFKLSKLLKSKISSKSAGRVQSVALKLIVEREKEIKSFIPEEYWTLEGEFAAGGTTFKASLACINGVKAKLNNEDEAMAAFAGCQGSFIVSNIKASVRKREPRPPFITSTLQQEASVKLGFSAKRTMTIAQRLYEGVETGSGQEGLITYMRTDSTRLSDVYISAAREKITSEYGSDYLGTYHVKNDERAQDGHEAIRPTSLANTPEKLSKHLTGEQLRLYRLIYARALASLMAPAVFDGVTVTLRHNEYDFTASGSTLKFPGYLCVYKDYDTAKDVILPRLEEGMTLTPEKLKPIQHFTEPPGRYTEAKLIKTLEEKGIGRPSTYAMIIDTIQARGYADLNKSSENSKTRVFFPTDLGILTSEKLEEFFADIINVSYTAEMENELDDIAAGKAGEKETLRAFYDKFAPLLDNAYDKMEKAEPSKVGETCPACGGELVYRFGRYGKFISCANFPRCRYTRKIADAAKEQPEPTGKVCPVCGGELLKRKSRYGTYFLGCGNFPRCRYMENLDGEKIETKASRPAGRKKKAAAKK